MEILFEGGPKDGHVETVPDATAMCKTSAPHPLDGVLHGALQADGPVTYYRTSERDQEGRLVFRCESKGWWWDAYNGQFQAVPCGDGYGLERVGQRELADVSTMESSEQKQTVTKEAADILAAGARYVEALKRTDTARKLNDAKAGMVNAIKASMDKGHVLYPQVAAIQVDAEMDPTLVVDGNQMGSAVGWGAAGATSEHTCARCAVCGPDAEDMRDAVLALLERRVEVSRGYHGRKYHDERAELLEALVTEIKAIDTEEL